MISEIRIKVFTLVDISVSEVLEQEAKFIDSALAKNPRWLEYHKEKGFKKYSFSGLYPLAKDGIYKNEEIYTITVRTADIELAKFLSKTLRNHYTSAMKGLTVENRVIAKKMIGEIYTLTPVVLKSENGYWKNQMSLEDFECRLFENAVKKYNQYTGKKMEEDFQFYTNLTFLNKKPIATEYKGVRLLGDKINLKIADNPRAQDLAYFLLGTGCGEMNSRGYGYCNFRYI